MSSGHVNEFCRHCGQPMDEPPLDDCWDANIVDEDDEFWTGCTDFCPHYCGADHRGEE